MLDTVLQNQAYKSFVKTNMTTNNTSEKINVEKIKRDVLQKQSDKQYEKDVKEHKSVTCCLIFASIASILLAPLISKDIRKENIVGGTIFGIGALLMPFLKPKKENYDKQVENDIKKEMENENIANK